MIEERRCHLHQQTRYALNYGSNLWSCCRNSSNNAWNANGNYGFFNNNNLYNELSAVPVSNCQRNQNTMMKVNYIIDAYITGRNNNRKSSDQVEFELHWQAECLRVYHDILNKSLRPTAYTFVADNPRPREIFASSMSVRVLHYYLNIRLRPLLEARMSRNSFNNRVGMGTSACQNAVISDIYEMSRGFTEDCYIIKVDIAGCFPNIVQDIAYNQLREVIESDYHGPDKDELLYALQVCIFAYPTKHCHRKSPLYKWKDIAPEKSLFTKPDGIGASIGQLVWQNAVNYYFNGIDLWLESIGVRCRRYVDDFYIISKSKTVLLLLPELRRRLAELGATMHPHKFYCQHYTKGLECLGVHIKMDRVYPNRRVIRRAIARVRKFNRGIRAENVEALTSTVNSYLGICKGGNGYAAAWKIINELNARWFKFVSFNTHRVCLEANPQYTKRNFIIHKYQLA